MPRSWICAVTLALVMPLLAGCTSPGSVRGLSAEQGRRLGEFREGLSILLEVAEQDRQANLAWRVDQLRNQIQVIDLMASTADAASKPELEAQKVDLQKRIDELVAAMGATRPSYDTYLQYLDRVLIPGNAALDEWHRRPGISLFDSDAVASWARSISQTGITGESLKGLRKELVGETGAELGRMKSDLSALMKEMDIQKAALEEIRGMVRELRGTPR